MRILLSLLALLIPRSERPRWREEWRAELQHGRWTMILGALPDAWAMRRINAVPPEGGSYTRLGLWFPASAGRRPGLFHALDQDLRYAVRTLTATPGFVLAMLLSLSIGIGANTTAFSFINALVFRPFPAVDRQQELVRVSIGTSTQRSFSPLGDYDSLRNGLRSVADLSAHSEAIFAVLTPGGASFVEGALVSGNYFAVLGVRPAAGRFFAGGDDRPWERPVAVISDKAWTRFFTRDPHVIGQTITVNGEALEIIGIAPPDFWGVRKGEDRPDVWIPLGLAELTLRDDEGRPARLSGTRNYWMDYVARLRPGVSLEQANAAAALLAAQLVTPGAEGQPSGRASRVWFNDPAENAPMVLAFMIAPLLVLAIACVNAANLMIARTERRARDWLVRLALGASRWRVMRQVLTEAVILAGLASGIGVAFAYWSLAAIRNQVPVPMPMDARVAAFTVIISALAALAFTLGPALSITSGAGRTGPVTALPAVARSGRRFALIAVQAALSLGLLVTGAEFTRTVFAANPNEASIPSPDRLVIASFDLDPLRMPPDAGQEFYERLGQRVRQIPGVVDAGLSTPGLVAGAMRSTRYSPRLWLPDSPAGGQRGFLAMELTPGGLAAIGVSMLQGRPFIERDGKAMDAVVVNRSFAVKFFGGHAVGRTLRLGTAEDPSAARDVTIVGITEGIVKRGDQEPAILYHPAPLTYSPAQTLFLRLDGGAAFDAAALHAAVRDTDPRVPIVAASTLADNRAGRHAERKLLARGAAALGALSLLLAAAGLYSVVAYLVSLRRKEMGIRLALGADPSAIVRLVVRQALTPTLIGASVGMAGAAAVAAIVESRMYGAAGTDPVAFAGAAALMLSVMWISSWWPARQAGRVNPADTLRNE
jgi:predicted permease